MTKLIMKLFLMISLVLTLAACSDNPEKARIKDYTDQTTIQLNELTKALSKGEIENAVILTSYAETFKTIKPEFSALADRFALMAISNSPAILDMKKRLKVVRDNPASLGDDKAVFNEINALAWASKKDMYGDSLLDVINTMSDLSGGQLARLNTPKKGENEKPATQLVGNPQYGQWQSESSGQSFWAWYGQYALISSLMGGSRYRYDDWSYNRGWSHYNDYGRDKVSTANQRSKYNSTVKKNAPALKQYGNKTGRTQSSYSANRSNPVHAKKLQVRKATAERASRYKSSYNSNSRYGSSASTGSSNRYSSSYSGSSRSSSYGSRSRFGGK